ncbi:MAG: cytochrome P450 [Sporichthyaceae bacterium]
MARQLARLVVGTAAAGGAAVALRRSGGSLARVRGTTRWAVNHGPARLGMAAAARAGDPMAKLVTDPAVRADPFAYYAELRAAAPVVHGRFASVTARHDVISDVLRDPEWRSGFPIEAMPAPLRGLANWALDPQVGSPLDPPSMLVSNGAEHEAYRRLATKAFTARAIAGLRAHVEELTEELLDDAARRFARGESVDAVTELADVLPVLVIADILGVPLDMRPRFRAWATVAAPSADLGVPFGTYRASERALRELSEWMLGHLVALRREPDGNLFSRMVAAADTEPRNGVPVTDAGLVLNANLLLLAGFETTVNLIGNGIDLLLRHPDQLAILRAEPELWPIAVEEILRFAAPVQNTFRYRLTDGEVHGTKVGRGTFLALLLAGANRDPSVFENPDVFDVRRANAREHVGFGLGAHFCVGAALARMEGEVVLRRLFERFEDLAVAGTPERRATRLFYGWAHLPVRAGVRHSG